MGKLGIWGLVIAFYAIQAGAESVNSCQNLFGNSSSQVVRGIQLVEDPLFVSSAKESETESLLKLLVMYSTHPLQADKVAQKGLNLAIDLGDAINGSAYNQKLGLLYTWDAYNSVYVLTGTRLIDPNPGKDGRGKKIVDEPLTAGLDRLKTSAYAWANTFEKKENKTLFLDSEVLDQKKITELGVDTGKFPVVQVPLVIPTAISLRLNKILEYAELINKAEILASAGNSNALKKFEWKLLGKRVSQVITGNYLRKTVYKVFEIAAIVSATAFFVNDNVVHESPAPEPTVATSEVQQPTAEELNKILTEMVAPSQTVQWVVTVHENQTALIARVEYSDTGEVKDVTLMEVEQKENPEIYSQLVARVQQQAPQPSEKVDLEEVDFVDASE